MKTNWICPKQKKDDLNGKSVEAKRAHRSVIARFVVKSNDAGQLSIVIRQDEQLTQFSMQRNEHVLQQEEADRIQPHPDTSVADFLLVYQ